MAEELEKPEIPEVDPAAPDEGELDATLEAIFAENPEDAEGDDAPAEEPVVAPTPAAAVISHPPELLDRATTLQIPADEVAAMSSDELRRVIKHADRIGQTVYDSFQKPVAAQTTVDPLAVLDDETKYDPEHIAPIKSIFSEQAKTIKALQDTVNELKNKTGQTEAQALHSQLMRHAVEVSPEIAKVFDPATKSGQAKYEELLEEMGVKQRRNPGLTEKEWFQRAIKGMGLVAEKTESPAVAAKKERWDAGALGTGAARKPSKTAEEKVGEILRQAALDNKKASRNGAPAK